MTTKAALAAIALTAGMFAQQAQAVTPVDHALADLIDFNSDNLGNSFAGAGAFSDHFTFTTDASAYLTDALLHTVKSEVTISSFGLYLASDNTLVGSTAIEVSETDSSVAQAGSGYWRFSGVNIAANTGYYVAVDGTVSSSGGTAYGGTVFITAVPEPETYAMLLGGLGIMAFLARRRKTA
ncbi:hypothetical protein CSQ96_26245 [Janthinobacterium sp. BJB412]|nr:hypothetical protein CSQ96_26245 [Janthinobacterium sp. BJB412]